MSYSAEVILSLEAGPTPDTLDVGTSSISVPSYQNCHEALVEFKRKARNMTHVCVVENLIRVKITFWRKALYLS